MTATPRLEFRNVTKRFASRRQGATVVAVEGVSLTIADGEVVSLIGPSGCGKSTLLNMGSGLDPVSAGEVFVDGELVTRPNRHVAFSVRDMHEVIGGGLQMARCGWETQLGPGRHPISSALFWYFKSPAGGLVEYFTDEDVLTENWTPRDFQPSPTAFAEWAIAGGIDGNTRRQKQG